MILWVCKDCSCKDFSIGTVGSMISWLILFVTVNVVKNKIDEIKEINKVEANLIRVEFPLVNRGVKCKLTAHLLKWDKPLSCKETTHLVLRSRPHCVVEQHAFFSGYLLNILYTAYLLVFIHQSSTRYYQIK